MCRPRSGGYSGASRSQANEKTMGSLGIHHILLFQRFVGWRWLGTATLGLLFTMVTLQARLRKWDSGSRAVRIRQLGEFIHECSHMTAPQLEHVFENGASLFLARISSWLRLSYALGQPVGLQLRAIGVFVAAPGGQRFLSEFVEVGGVVTVVEIIKIPHLTYEDAALAIQLLSSVAASGRHFKEIICEGQGIGALESLVRGSKSEDQIEEVRDLLVLLGQANPNFSAPVHQVQPIG